MTVRVRLFAAIREALGREVVDLDLPEGATPEDAWRELSRIDGGGTLAARRHNLAAAVNRRYAKFDTPLSDGDEVVFIPPVSGG
ncbi:MAG TPA: molybdopterin converting factor subunit 1 [Vicinamibacteria bacterium]|nr:molybdopterin converting factor subunit 1 [Vicinamibacteria bacterium]